MPKVRFVAPLFAACLLSAPASALEPYVSLYGGVSLLDDADNRGDPFVPGADDTSVKSEFDPGFVVGGTAGVALDAIFDVRVELDVNYRQHDVDDLVVKSDGGLGAALGIGSLDGASASDAGIDVEGDVGTLGALVNYWIDITNRTPFTPYFGGGLGLAWIRADVEAEDVKLVDDDDVVFAWQVGAGARLSLTDNLSLSLDYRWFATSDPEFEHEGNEDFESEYSSHNFMAGVAYSF